MSGWFDFLGAVIGTVAGLCILTVMITLTVGFVLFIRACYNDDCWR